MFNKILIKCYFLLVFCFVPTFFVFRCGCEGASAIPSHYHSLMNTNDNGKAPCSTSASCSLTQLNVSSNTSSSTFGCLPSSRKLDDNSGLPADNISHISNDKDKHKQKEEVHITKEPSEDSGVATKQVMSKHEEPFMEPANEGEKDTTPSAAPTDAIQCKKNEVIGADLYLDSFPVSFSRLQSDSSQRNKILLKLRSRSSVSNSLAASFVSADSYGSGIKNPDVAQDNDINITKNAAIDKETENNKESYKHNEEEKLVVGQELVSNLINSFSGVMVHCINPTFEAFIGEEFKIDLRDASTDPNVIRNDIFTAFINQLPPASGSAFIRIIELHTNHDLAGDASVICASEGRFSLEFLVVVTFGLDLRVASHLCSAQAVCSKNPVPDDPKAFRIFFHKQRHDGFPCINDCITTTTTRTTTTATIASTATAINTAGNAAVSVIIPNLSNVLTLNNGVSEASLSLSNPLSSTAFPNFVLTNGNYGTSAASPTLVDSLKLGNDGSIQYTLTVGNAGNIASAPTNVGTAPTVTNSFANFLPSVANLGDLSTVIPSLGTYPSSFSEASLGNSANLSNAVVIGNPAQPASATAASFNMGNFVTMGNASASANSGGIPISVPVNLVNISPNIVNASPKASTASSFPLSNTSTQRTNSPVIQCLNNRLYGRLGGRIEYAIVPFEIIAAFAYPPSTSAVNNTNNNVVAIIHDADSKIVKIETQEITSTGQSFLIDRTAVAVYSCLREGTVAKEYFIVAIDESSNITAQVCPVTLVCSRNQLPVVRCKTTGTETSLVRTSFIGETVNINLEGVDNDLFIVTDEDSDINSLRVVMQSAEDNHLIFSLNAFCAGPIVRQVQILVTPYDSENEGMPTICSVIIQCIAPLIGTS